MVSELTSGPCIAVEVKKQGTPDVVQAFREFCGPSDAQIAQRLRPNSLRARFGVDRIKNAVHCTDLTEDGVLEVEYFFKILQD
jgi:nucleoside-diphosphate kinase